jgi:hypothetical protein
METQEESAPSSSTQFVDDINQRLVEIFTMAQKQFRTAGLTYSEKLHQFFVDLGNAPAAEGSDENVETSTTTEA